MRWKNDSNIRRRSFIKAASVASISSTCLYGGIKGGLTAAATEKEVPYIKYLKGTPEPIGEGRKPIYDSIPREEWERRWTAVDLRDKIGYNLNNKYRSDLLSSEFTSMKSSPTAFGVNISYTEIVDDGTVVRSPDPSIEQVRNEFEGEGKGEAAKGPYQAKRDGIPVTVKRRREEKSGCADDRPLARHTLDGILAGIDMRDSSDGEKGSICAPFFSDNHGSGWIVSGHAVSDGGFSGNVEQGGDTTYTDSPEKFGEVKEGEDSVDIDWAFVENTVSDKFTVSEVADPDDITTKDYKIGGIVTDEKLINEQGTGYLLKTQGERTRRLSGSIYNVGGNRSSYVTTDQNTENGDSGGVLFDVGPNDYYAYVAGVIVSKINAGLSDFDSCLDDTKSTTAETVESHANGHFRKY